MRPVVSAVCLGWLAAAGAARADDVRQAAVPVGKDTPPVTITGCLLAGTKPDTFVLKDVTDSAGRAADVIYWLSSTRGLKDHVGHTIEVDARGKEAKAKTTDPDASPSTRTKEHKAMPVHRIKVQSVRMLAMTCL